MNSMRALTNDSRTVQVRSGSTAGAGADAGAGAGTGAGTGTGTSTDACAHTPDPALAHNLALALTAAGEHVAAQHWQQRAGEHP